MIQKIALIGASADPAKYGNIILRDLLRKGFSVYPVNPKLAELEGCTVYPEVERLPADVELLVFVVPPDVGFPIARRAVAAGFRRLWFQPGAGSPEIGEYFEAQDGVLLVMNRCIMVESNGRPLRIP